MRKAPNRPLYQSVRRERTESSMGFFSSAGMRVFGWCLRLAENIAAAASSLQQGFAGFVAQFAAQAVHIDFDEVGKGVEGLVPNVLGNFGAANDAAGIAREIFEQGIFLNGEGNGAGAAFCGLRGSVEFEIADDDAWRAELVGAAKKG